MRREEERIRLLKLERVRREYEEQRAERMRRAYEEQVQRFQEQRREIKERVALEYPLDSQNPVQHPTNFQRAYPTSVVALNEALKTNQAPLHEPLPPTSASNPSTVVQMLLPQDDTSLGLTTVVGTQPSVAMNFAAIQPQTVAAQPQTTVAGFAVNLSATVNPTTAVSMAISTAQWYIFTWRRPHTNLHQMHDHNLNAGGPRQDGTVRTTTVARVASRKLVAAPECILASECADRESVESSRRRATKPQSSVQYRMGDAIGTRT